MKRSRRETAERVAFRSGRARAWGAEDFAARSPAVHGSATTSGRQHRRRPRGIPRSAVVRVDRPAAEGVLARAERPFGDLREPHVSGFGAAAAGGARASAGGGRRRMDAWGAFRDRSYYPRRKMGDRRGAGAPPRNPANKHSLVPAERSSGRRLNSADGLWKPESVCNVTGGPRASPSGGAGRAAVWSPLASRPRIPGVLPGVVAGSSGSSTTSAVVARGHALRHPDGRGMRLRRAVWPSGAEPRRRRWVAQERLAVEAALLNWLEFEISRR
jgi:hypothetical protein